MRQPWLLLVFAATFACGGSASSDQVVRLRLPSGVIDLAWDETHQLLYAAGGLSPLLAAIDPAEGRIVSSVSKDRLQNVSLSANRRYLYAGSGSPGQPFVTRYDLPGLTNETILKVPTPPSGSPAIPNGTYVRASPLEDLTFAVSTTAQRNQLWIYANGWLPTAQTGLYPSIAWGGDRATLYAASAPGNQIHRFLVTTAGVEPSDAAALGNLRTVDQMYFEPGNRFLLADLGEIIATDAVQAPRITLDYNLCMVAPDTNLNRVFYACEHDNFTPPHHIDLHSFDLTTGEHLDSRSLDSDGPLERVARWGANGFAIGTHTEIILYSGDFVR